MDSLSRVRAALEAHGQVLCSEDLDRLGLGPATVRQLVAGGELHRYRRSAFVDGPAWRAAPPWERHTLRARAVARSLGMSLGMPDGPYLLSHHSALVLHGVGVFGVDDLVHLVRTDGGRGRKDSTVHVHPPVPPSFAAPPEARSGELPTVTVGHACAQVAAGFGTEAGLVVADAALRQQLTTPTLLVEAARDVTGRDSSAVLDAIDHLLLEHPAIGLSTYDRHADGEQVLLARWGDGRLYAVGARCTHYGGPLEEGLVVDDTVRCPWHHAAFNLKTGRNLRPPALNHLPSWRVEERDGVAKVTSREAEVANTTGDAAASSPRHVPESVVIVGGGAVGAVAVVGSLADDALLAGRAHGFEHLFALSLNVF